MIFLCSVPTGPGPAIDGQLSDMVSPAFVTATRFHDEQGREVLENQRCPSAVLRRLLGGRRQLGSVHVATHNRPGRWLSRRRFEPGPPTPQSVVLTSDDRVLNREWAVAAARERLAGQEPVLLPGSHSPFLSRPADLADVLADEARR